MPFFLKFFIWVICAFLYVMQTSPIFSRIFNNQLWIPNGSGDYHTYVLPIIGIVISIIGIIIESVADKQKSNQKKINPNMVPLKDYIRWFAAQITSVKYYSGLEYLSAQ